MSVQTEDTKFTPVGLKWRELRRKEIITVRVPPPRGTYRSTGDRRDPNVGGSRCKFTFKKEDHKC